jgi:hypothetical protein
MGRSRAFVAAGVLAGLNFLYGLTVFPETLAHENRRPFTLSRANPLGSWRVLRAQPGMLNVALVLLFWQLAGLVYPLTWSFYGIAQFGWSDRMIGLSLAAVGVTIAFGVPDRPRGAPPGRARCGDGGIIGAAIGFVTYAFTTSTIVAFAILAALAVQSLVQPSVMAMLIPRHPGNAGGSARHRLHDDGDCRRDRADGADLANGLVHRPRRASPFPRRAVPDLDRVRADRAGCCVACPPACAPEVQNRPDHTSFAPRNTISQ